MQTSIAYLADLFSGVYVNTSASRGGDVYYLQVRHWTKNREWVSHAEPDLAEERKLGKNYLEPGDVLLATKGVDLFAALYDGRYSPAIASSVFTVIRLKDKNVILPEYLQWYLNHPATAKKLIVASRGTSIPLITRNEIEQLVVPVPSLKKQRAILKAEDLQQQAIRLRSRISRLNETIFHHNLLQTAYR